MQWKRKRIGSEEGEGVEKFVLELEREEVDQEKRVNRVSYRRRGGSPIVLVFVSSTSTSVSLASSLPSSLDRTSTNPNP